MKHHVRMLCTRNDAEREPTGSDSMCSGLFWVHLSKEAPEVNGLTQVRLIKPLQQGLNNGLRVSTN